MSTAIKRRFKTITAPLLVAVLVAAGCATAPVQEMSNARQALKAAADSGAVVTASAEYREAEQLLKSAESKLEQRSYRSARRDAERAKLLAVRALEASITADYTPNR